MQSCLFEGTYIHTSAPVSRPECHVLACPNQRHACDLFPANKLVSLKLSSSKQLLDIPSLQHGTTLKLREAIHCALCPIPQSPGLSHRGTLNMYGFPIFPCVSLGAPKPLPQRIKHVLAISHIFSPQTYKTNGRLLFVLAWFKAAKPTKEHHQKIDPSFFATHLPSENENERSRNTTKISRAACHFSPHLPSGRKKTKKNVGRGTSGLRHRQGLR